MKYIAKIFMLLAVGVFLFAGCSDDDDELEVNPYTVLLNKKTTSLSIGQSETLIATVVPEKAVNKNVSWTSDNTNIASVNGDGEVIGVAAGEATITVTTEDGKKTAFCKVTVTVGVTGISLNKSETTICVDQTETLIATLSPEDATEQRVMWKSDKASIATVDKEGKVTGIAVGEVIITAITGDGKKTATCKVTVEPAPIAVTGVELNKTEMTLAKDESETLTATILPKNATNQNVTWISDKTDIATVDENGKVMGVKIGEANITVTTEDGSKTATCKVTVVKGIVKVTTITLNETNLSLDKGTIFTLIATVEPDDATDNTVAWSSSAPDVATVVDGTVTALKAGNVTITATANDGSGVTATCAVKVVSPVTGIVISPAALSLEKGKSANLKAVITPEDATDKTVTWKSSNEAIATVDNTGKVTALEIGNVTITATSTDGKQSGNCTVMVTRSFIWATNIALNKNEIRCEVGHGERLTVILTPIEADEKLIWISSNEAVATVDDQGNVKTVASGEATITVKGEKSGVAATCKVYAKDKSDIGYGDYDKEDWEK